MSRLGLATIIFAYLFWYGLGLLHPYNDYMEFPMYTYTLVLISLFSSIIGYRLIYRKKADIEFPDEVRSARVNFSIYIVVALTAAVIIISVATQGSGMLGYHLIRAEVACGILMIVLGITTGGKVRLICTLLFVVILAHTGLTYSRRPFLTLMAPIILIPLVLNRYKMSKLIPIAMISVAIAGILLIGITGNRYAINAGEGISLHTLLLGGVDVFLRAEGFDTVFLTDYTVRLYQDKDYLNGATFLGGVMNFVPRAIWTDKPIAFGMMLSADYFSLDVRDIFTNFGPGFVSESYANGGFFGVLLFSLVLGAVVGVLDNKIEINRGDMWYLILAVIFYPSLFFVVRGDFLNSYYEFYSKALVAYLAILAARSPAMLRSRGVNNRE